MTRLDGSMMAGMVCGSDTPAIEARGLRFAYPGAEAPVLDGLDWSVPQGAFALLVGGTGSGKSTLLSLLKPEISPTGECAGELRVLGESVADMDVRASAERVGYVFQDPENQIVCETVWHEMAFGLENLGMSRDEMRRPYINLTIQAMKAFGVEVNVERIPAKDGKPEVTNFRVSSGSYRTPGNVAVEGDWSNAAFWLCAGAIGSDPITVEGVSLSSAQGDRNVLAALSRFGARIVRSTNAATVQSDKLAGFEMSAHDIPDLVPVISAVASLAQGRTFIRDCARLRIKESDRLATTTRELTALGAQVRIAGDDLIIKGVDTFTGGEVDSHNDHRIAMMAAIAASRATGEVVIHGAEAVNKSYPDFFDHYRLLGGKVTLEEE